MKNNGIIEKCLIQVKNGRTWNTTNQILETDVDGLKEIYKSLAHDLTAKKLHKCTYIKSIADRCNYDGTRTITVTYDNNCRRIYIVEM